MRGDRRSWREPRSSAQRCLGLLQSASSNGADRARDRGLTDICPGISAPLSPMCPSTAYRKLTHVASKLAGNDHPIEGSFVMKLYVDTSAKNITVSKDPE